MKIYSDDKTNGRSVKHWSGLKLEIFKGYPGYRRGVSVIALLEHPPSLISWLKTFPACPPSFSCFKCAIKHYGCVYHQRKLVDGTMMIDQHRPRPNVIIFVLDHTQISRGNFWGKNAVLPQKSPENPPKVPTPSALGKVWGVSQCCSYMSHPNNTLGLPRKIRV